MLKKELDLGTCSTLHNRAKAMKSPSGKRPLCASDRPLRSGELARILGVSRDTLRHYERHGLLPEPLRTRNGYRSYPPSAAARVRLVRGALAIGFSVEELGRILGTRDRGGAPCHDVHRMAERKLAELDRSIAELSALRAQLARTVRGWKKQLAGSGPQPAHLLERFIAAYPESATAVSPLISPGLRRRLKKSLQSGRKNEARRK
jgi:DNA-binding transcriptional MerR regulator